MAVTIVVKKRSVAGATRRVIIDVTGPASYTTGGEALTLAQLQQVMADALPATNDWSVIKSFDSEVNPTSTPAFLALCLDRTNNKMLFTAAGAQAASLANLSAQTVRAELVYGSAIGE